MCKYDGHVITNILSYCHYLMMKYTGDLFTSKTKTKDDLFGDRQFSPLRMCEHGIVGRVSFKM